jgi:hypothetical protein
VYCARTARTPRVDAVENAVGVVESRAFDLEWSGNQYRSTFLEPYRATKLVRLSLTLTEYVVPGRKSLPRLMASSYEP